MKKKVKDFTEKEIDDICDKNYCMYCPFHSNDLLCIAFNKELWGDLEIEYD